MPKVAPGGSVPGGKEDSPGKDFQVKAGGVTKQQTPTPFKNYQPRVCSICNKTYQPTNSKGKRCAECTQTAVEKNNEAKVTDHEDDMICESINHENYPSQDSLVSSYVAQITLLKSQLEEKESELLSAQRKIIELEDTNVKLSVKVSKLILDLDDATERTSLLCNPMPKSFAEAVFPAPAKTTLQTIILKPTLSTEKKLDKKELLEIKTKIENELQKNALTINAKNIRAANQGKILIDLTAGSNKAAIEKLNELSNSTGYVATETQKKNPRLIIKDIPNDFIPDDPNEICHKLAENNASVKQLLTSGQEMLKHVITLRPKRNGDTSIVIETSPNIRKVLTSEGRIRFGMCVYDIADHIRITQCSNCTKFGHSAKFCNNGKIVCGICGLQHITKNCSLFETRKSDRLAYLNDSSKNCSNCSNSFKHKPNSHTHGAIDLSSCPLYKVQIERAKDRINYDALHHPS